MPVLVMVNLKGGVAKTTNAVAIAECLADAGRKVLVVDADHQCMASELLVGGEPFAQCERRGSTVHGMLAANSVVSEEPGAETTIDVALGV